MNTALGVALAAIIGLVCGGIAGNAAYRLARDPPNDGADSPCPSCRAAPGAGDPLPLFAWLARRGRCRQCGAPLRLRYPVIEGVVAALFIAVYLQAGATTPGLLLAALAVGLVMLSAVDLETGIIPDRILVNLAPLGVIYSVVGGSRALDDVAQSLIGGGFAGGVAYAVHYGFKRWRGRDGLGLGDVKFFAVAGLWLGPYGLPAFMIVSGVSGIAFALLWRRLGGGREFPFGPSLALGLFICLMVPAITRLLG